MALGKRGSFLWRLTGRQDTVHGEKRRHARRSMEERYQTLTRATEQWESLLREMEHTGQSGAPQYETYYRAYLQSRDHQKRVDLELFNLRRGLSVP